ncbi:LAFE_0B09252g1_1 [Lachancea fermentati]|uniref:LAFE_0B09252g1_1 n=1 Tax=Lachancea fermentati TaxID=4955 RepID=A0A1G4M8G1_LACFM|nr:LAFE_0B09252g1_1 [Lachancea fermentati]
MKTFSAKAKSKRPKFLFSLKINELTNIPQSSGYCSVKWHLKDGTGTNGHHISSATQEPIKASSQSRGSTPRVLVKNHRARWNIELDKPIQIKLTTDKNKKLHSKILNIDVYFEFLEPINGSGGKLHHARGKSDTSNQTSSSNSSVYTQKVSRKLLLGSLSINIAEYINREQTAVTNRFLLQNSKVNSILSLAIRMELIRGSFDDFKLPDSFSSGQLPNSFRNGIGEVFDESSDMPSPVSSTFPASTTSPGSGQVQSLDSQVKKATETQGSFTIAINNPFVDRLYQKTFQIPWDPRPGEFTPKECVDDIFEGGDGWAKNESGINLIDIEALQLSELERNYGSQRNTLAADITYGDIDKRAYLERRIYSESQVNSQRQHSSDDRESSNLGNDACENEFDEYESNKINDFKSWTISKILP